MLVMIGAFNFIGTICKWLNQGSRWYQARAVMLNHPEVDADRLEGNIGEWGYWFSVCFFRAIERDFIIRSHALHGNQ